VATAKTMTLSLIGGRHHRGRVAIARQTDLPQVRAALKGRTSSSACLPQFGLFRHHMHGKIQTPGALGESGKSAG